VKMVGKLWGKWETPDARGAPWLSAISVVWFARQKNRKLEKRVRRELCLKRCISTSPPGF